MELYELNYILHEPCEEHGWLYMAEIPELPGCRAWSKTANSTLAELTDVAEQFILSYKECGDPLPKGIVPSPKKKGRITVTLWHTET